ncbi:hypothetical protein [Trabulsiella odontotermitis]|uniref:hypothetical protein n=1 Tax=Trabulsiella odontotermitis TaxID=379893 RepID=UPI000AC1D7BB
MGFKHELGQAIQVTVSGEIGHVKGRAEYTTMNTSIISTTWQLMAVAQIAGLLKMSCRQRKKMVWSKNKYQLF